jgi:hypothetical protein
VDWLVDPASPLWLMVLLAVSGVAATVTVLLVVEMARDRGR